MTFALAEKVANAVLYEGYVLYPYRASSPKNQVRWQFGIVAPRGWVERGGADPCSMQTECLVDGPGTAALTIRVRFLQAQARTVEEAASADATEFRAVASLDIGDHQISTWDEGIERSVDLGDVALSDLIGREVVERVELPAGREVEMLHDEAGKVVGRLVRDLHPISASICVSAVSLGNVTRVRVGIENDTPWLDDSGMERDHAMRHSLLGAHTLLAVRGGEFVSLLEPPEWAKSAVASCDNQRTWPVLIGAEGDRSTMLSSPIILYDYPATAPESTGDLFDATEIDEILMLRVMTLTDDEKRQARGTDARSRQIIERSDTIPPELFERLHGAIRTLNPPQRAASNDVIQEISSDESRWEVFAAEDGESGNPEEAWAGVDGKRIMRGSRVLLRPKRRADSMDMFLDGRAARVEAVQTDLEGLTYIAVTVDDDPAADMHQWYGRYFYFYPDEIEPLDAMEPEAAAKSSGLRAENLSGSAAIEPGLADGARTQ